MTKPARKRNPIVVLSVTCLMIPIALLVSVGAASAQNDELLRRLAAIERRLDVVERNVGTTFTDVSLASLNVRVRDLERRSEALSRERNARQAPVNRSDDAIERLRQEQERRVSDLLTRVRGLETDLRAGLRLSNETRAFKSEISNMRRSVEALGRRVDRVESDRRP